MALKPTIYKLGIALSDLDREVFDSLNLTIAQHPSETLERMMVRVLAYCFNVAEGLQFCKGLSDTEEPALWQHSLDGSLQLWIDVGEPAVERVKKASRLAPKVKVYSFNHKASTWWDLNQHELSRLSAVIYQFQWEQIKALAGTVARTMDISITITDASAYIATEQGEFEVALQTCSTSAD